MKVVIIGAGRMGVRHALGLNTFLEVSKIVLVDIFPIALVNAEGAVSGVMNKEKFHFILNEDFLNTTEDYDVAIIASTAGNRLETLNSLIKKNVKHVLLEKPLGQSLEEVEQMVDYLEQYPTVKTSVNFSFRLLPTMIQLKRDLQRIPQMDGFKTISVNTGAIGIGANGIHLLDMCFFLFDADRAEIIAAEIEDTTIPSGRGAQFNDFGGWAVIKYYNINKCVGKLMISVSSSSTAFGPIEIIGSNGRIQYDEVRGTRLDSLRNESSTFPVYRYHGDYLPDVKKEWVGVSISELTNFWFQNVLNNQFILPSVEEALMVHKLLFDWLSNSKTHSNFYPIT
jgi:predicted dehydrogenase